MTSGLHLAPRFRMIGAISLLPLYVFVVWAGTALLLYFIYLNLEFCGEYVDKKKKKEIE
jgi:hypothetical protein